MWNLSQEAPSPRAVTKESNEESISRRDFGKSGRLLSDWVRKRCNLPFSCKSRAPAAVNCFAIEPVRNLVAVEFLTFNSASAQPHAREKIVAPFRDSAATRMNVFDWHALEK